MSLSGIAPYKIYRTLALNASGDGVAVTTLSGTLTMSFLDEQFQSLDGGLADRDVVLPAADPDHKGVFYVIANAGTTNSLVIKDGGSTRATLNVGEHGIFAATSSAWKAMLVTSSLSSDIFAANGAYTGNNTHSGTEVFSNAAGVSTDVITERSASVGVTIDGVLIKDSNIVDSVGFYDAASPTKIVRLDAGAVTAGQTRVLAMPDANVTMGAYAPSLLNVADEAAFKAAVNLEIGTDVQAYSATLGILAANARDALVKASVACADATGGSTTALMTAQLSDLGGTAITSARQFLLQVSGIQYADSSGPGDANLSLGTVTAGAIISTPNAGGLFLVQTDATGLFACTVTNTADTTRYFSAKSADGGVSVVGEGCVVVVSNSDSATWSA